MRPRPPAVMLLAVGVLLLVACNRVRPHIQVPDVRLGEAAFYPTIEAWTRAPITAGNDVEILLNGDEIFPALLGAVRSAKQTVTYLQYSWEASRMASALVSAFAERCRAGVAVHVLIDGVGGMTFAPEHRETLARAGCHVAVFRPLGPFTLRKANNRNHRRVLVVDGRVGWTGGSGVGPKWEGDGRTEGHWRDTDVKVVGPVVQQLQAAFVEDWREATGIVLGDAPYFPGDLPRRGDVAAQVVASSPRRGASEMYTSFLLAIGAARRSISITNPYFLPDKGLLEAMVAARSRGVRVRVLLPGAIDHAIVKKVSRAGFEPLFAAGIEIYEYQAALLHAKTMVIDGVWSTIGTTNFDNRSFALHEELNLVMYSRRIGERMERIFEDDLTRARRVTVQQWKRRPVRDRLLEVLGGPLRDQL